MILPLTSLGDLHLPYRPILLSLELTPLNIDSLGPQMMYDGDFEANFLGQIWASDPYFAGYSMMLRNQNSAGQFPLMDS